MMKVLKMPVIVAKEITVTVQGHGGGSSSGYGGCGG